MGKGLCPSRWSAETCVHIHFALQFQAVACAFARRPVVGLLPAGRVDAQIRRPMARQELWGTGLCPSPVLAQQGEHICARDGAAVFPIAYSRRALVA